MEPRIYAWSLTGELLEVLPLAEFAAAHEIEPRRLLAELLLVQAVVGRDPEPLVLAEGTGDVFLTLTPRLWPMPLH